jgi:hypothetical protein
MSLSKILCRFGWGARLVGGAKLTRRNGYAGTSGWVRSLEESKPVDASGQPLPWYTYACVSFLDARLPSDLLVFEFGAGNSTLWWLERCRQLTSVEHDREWFDYLSRSFAGKPTTLLLREHTEEPSYANAVAEFDEPFDVIVVDGRNRVQCALNGIERLTGRGVLIWDDVDRPRYDDGVRQLLERGFRKLDFHGLAPVSPRARTTAIFYRAGNCLGI